MWNIFDITNIFGKIDDIQNHPALCKPSYTKHSVSRIRRKHGCNGLGHSKRKLPKPFKPIKSDLA